MPTRQRSTELAVWGAISLLAGFIPAWVDLSSTAIQGPALLLMIVNFAITLPGRAPIALVAICTWLALPIAHAVRLHDVNPGMVVALIPALIAATGGRVAGGLLDSAVSAMGGPVVDGDIPWYQRPLSTRFLLAVALIAIAALPVPPISVVLSSGGTHAPTWVAMVWQIITLLGWIACTPLILHERRMRRPSATAAAGIRPLELLAHILFVCVLAVIHAATVVALTALLRIPPPPELGGWPELARFAFKIYLPLDCLAYVTILTLGFASDVDRHRREAEQREAALKSETLESRLAALRSRLNPHFLFNALNSVNVLARTGKPDETARLVEGITALLRYVLDERRASVPLREELDFARQYLEVQRVRFGDRLRFQISSSPQSDEALVPQLVLQPIIENAVEHGIAETIDGGVVTVHTTSDADTLQVIVDNDGPPPVTGAAASGIGLANTRERLRRLFGDRARLTLEPTSPHRGTRVTISMPFDPSTSTA